MFDDFEDDAERQFVLDAEEMADAERQLAALYNEPEWPDYLADFGACDKPQPFRQPNQMI